MSSMSNTRKDIAERLGFAANNGAKVSFERYEIGDAFKFEDKIYVINSHANEINAVLSSADSNAKKALSLADFAHSKWLQFEGKAKSSRPGAKAAFAQPNNDRAYAAILKQAAKVALDAWKLAVQKEEAYLGSVFVNPTKQREIEARTQSAYELAKRLNPDYQGFSRPGVKAKFADNDAALSKFLVKYKDNENNNYHSENVVLLANFVGSSSEIAQAKDILKKVRAAGHLPPDLNDEQYSLYKNLAAKLKSKYPGAKFSRPGAKAKMDRWEAAQTNKHGKPITEHTATINGVSYMIEKPNAMGTTATLYMWNENRGNERIATGDVAELKSRAEGMRKKEARGVAAIERLANYSRPGAKAKFGNKRSIEIMLMDGKIPASAFSWEGNTLTVDPNYRDQIVSVLKSYVPWEIKSMPAMQLRASRPGAKATMGMKLVKTFPAGSNNLSAKIYKDSDYDSYLVKFFENGKHNANADYDTEDLQDAVGTAEYSISHYKASRPGAKAKMGMEEDYYSRGVRAAQMSGLVPDFKTGVQDSPWFQLGYKMGEKYGLKASGMIKSAPSEFPKIAARITPVYRMK